MSNRNLNTLTVLLFCSVMAPAYAALPDCDNKNLKAFESKICKNEKLKELNLQLKEKYLSAQLMSNASLGLLDQSQNDWYRYLQKCKNSTCIQEQFEQRLDDLTFIMNMNQSLTQHFIRYYPKVQYNQLATIQLQQLDKNKIKIEANQYRHPHNSRDKRVAYLRSYTSSDLKGEIVDLETKCTYQLQRHGHVLKFSSQDTQCQRFVGTYKLYD